MFASVLTLLIHPKRGGFLKAISRFRNSQICLSICLYAIFLLVVSWEPPLIPLCLTQLSQREPCSWDVLDFNKYLLLYGYLGFITLLQTAFIWVLPTANLYGSTILHIIYLIFNFISLSSHMYPKWQIIFRFWCFVGPRLERWKVYDELHGKNESFLMNYDYYNYELLWK